MKVKELLETATVGSTSAGNIATVPNPRRTVGPDLGKKSYTGSPGKSGTKSPKQVVPKMQKPTDNALDKKQNIFGETLIKR
jgi:hypothetical protein